MTINRACIILWVILFTTGMWLAMHRPLWNDELCSQKVAIEGASWQELLTGNIHELNNPPLYYALQKIITSVVPLRFPDDFIHDYGFPVERRKYFLYVYPKGQILLRILPDIFMVTARVFLMRFFWIRDGIMAGLIALLSALSSGMVWGYWAEARPYALWFLLTMFQTLFLLEILSQTGSSGRVKVPLAICNCLLALTVTLGLFQIIIAQMILFVFGQRRLRDHFWQGVLPVCIALFYFIVRSSGNMSPGNMFYFAVNPVEMIRLNLSFEQASLLFFYLMAYLCCRVWISGNYDEVKKIWKGLLHLPNLLIFLFFSILFIVYVYWRWPGTHGGVPIYGRHFLFLSVLGIVLVSSMFSDLWSGAKGSPFWRWIFGIFFIVLLFSQFLEGFANAWYQGYYF